MNERFLLIDDNTDLLFAYREVINSNFPDSEIKNATTGMEGLKLVKDFSPDLIILDIILPDIDGYELCRKFKNEESICDVPVIMVSGFEKNTASLVKSLECGACIFLKKPFDNDVLLAEINTALKIKQTDDILKKQNKSLINNLEKSIMQYDELFNSMNDAIVIHDIDGNILQINNEAYEITGYSNDELLMMKISDLTGNKNDDLEGIKLKEYFKKNRMIYETIFFNKSGKSIPVEISSRLCVYKNKSAVLNVIRNISDRKINKKEKEVTIQLLKLTNSNCDLYDYMKIIIVFMQNWSGCESVGIRIKESDDFPYYITKGFSNEFVKLETSLCAKDLNGQLINDEIGNPVYECMCGNVICGRFDPTKPFFTEYGSFWSNCTTELLATTTEKDRQSRTRNRCNGEGYESVALIPLKYNNTAFGLLQFNDRQKNKFDNDLIGVIEHLAEQISISLWERKLRKDLDESEKLYRSLFENLLNGYAYCKMHFKDGKPIDWTYLMVNKAFEKLTGLKNVTGKKVTEVIPGILNTSKNLFEIYGKVASSGIPEKFEYFLTPLNMWFEVSVFSPKTDHFVAIFDVITDRKLSEERLKESEERFRLSFENANVGMCLFDLEGWIFKVNHEMTSIFGYSSEELEIVGQRSDSSRIQKYQSIIY